MAPSSKRRRSVKPKKKTSAETTATRRIITRSIYKKEQLLLLHQKPASSSKLEKTRRFVDNKSSSFDNKFVGVSITINDMPSSSSNNNSNDPCSTPKSDKYKIPEVKTCPPAPMKPRNSKSLFQKRRPISFFAHPDLDKFFVFAMKDIKV